MSIFLLFLLMGLGEFGVVYRATLSGWRGKEQDLIAVKTLKGTLMNSISNLIPVE